MQFSTRFPQLFFRLFLFAALPFVCTAPVYAQANLNYKGELEFAFVNKFIKVWDSDGLRCASVSFWQPTVPKGYMKVGDFGQVGRDDPTDKSVVVVVKALNAKALAGPTDFTLVWWDAKNKCFFWQPLPPEGYVAMGTVVTSTGKKPQMEAVACIRKDLVVQGSVGTRIWDDHGSGATWNTAIYPIGAAIPPQGVAYFTPGTFLSVSTMIAPTSHPCAWKFQIAIPAQPAVEISPPSPALKNFEKPGPYAAGTVKQTCLLPWFAVKDDALSAADKLAKSPYYKLERTDRYKLVFHAYNKSDSERTEKISYKLGFSKSALQTWLAATAIEVTGAYKLGDSAKSELRRSIQISENLAFGGRHSTINTNEATKETSMTVEPGTAKAVYVIESTYRLRRDSGKGEVVGGELTASRPGSVRYAVYPPPVRKQLEGTGPLLQGVERYVSLKGEGSFTKRGSEWVVADGSGSGTTVFKETGRDKEWITILDARRNLTVRLPVSDGMCYSSVDSGKTWSEGQKVKLAK